MVPPSDLKSPTFLGRLIEARTLASGNVKRRVAARVDWNRVPAEAISTIKALLDLSGPPTRAALPALLRFEFDPRRLTVEDCLGRLIVSILLNEQGARTLILAPIPYQGRPRWDVYGVEINCLAILGRRASESDALNHLVHGGLDSVLWSPSHRDSQRPGSSYLLEYSRTYPSRADRSWFGEAAARAEEESAQRRSLLVECAGAVAELPQLRARLDQAHRALREAWQQFVVISHCDMR